MYCTRCCGSGHVAESCNRPVRPFLRFGVTDLQGILDRCRVDAETGCWVWSMGESSDGLPMVMVRDANDKPRTQTAMRASWLLSGRSITDGHVVYRAHCGRRDCCNPEHMATGTRAEMRRACAASGREKGPHRRAQAILRGMETATPIEKVRAVEALRDAGKLQREISAETGVGRDTIRRILSGRHPHSRSAIQSVSSSSVFNWRPA